MLSFGKMAVKHFNSYFVIKYIKINEILEYSTI